MKKEELERIESIEKRLFEIEERLEEMENAIVNLLEFFQHMVSLEENNTKN